MNPRVHLITLGVSDLERSRAFYQDGLGFPASRSATDGIIFFQTGGVSLALYPVDKLAEDISPDLPAKRIGFPGLTLAHVAKTKKEVDDVLASAEKSGGKIEKPAQDTFWGGYSGYFSDPDGHYWEVAFAESWEFNEDGSLLID